ncbi:DeoR/GlpR family DNA-binding transcription regulator [Deinococcus hopiensis]|uniref:Transcriptional regulator, DeoR family n=1 Tax=Deinococcus hopiensis KR-140 TaxID=695939 RepID=A0A1W1UKR8_9DEIO|nr:DeoR/GlpR family DNA-binding transcription regulator [Deinococcus hopiensis]SMB81715.1 transcriptional regulator, DeoR family [Deinococcus hopiensis KR-140]
MFAEERQNQILAELKTTGRVEVQVLAGRYGVSEHTIRRDLSALESRGHLQKTHGGAVALATAHLDWQGRATSLPEAKDRIGRRAARLIQSGETVILDASSTTLALARHLTVRPLTIITNSLDIAAVFEQEAEVELIVTGGAWKAPARALRGQATREVIRQYRADWTVLGACALHPRAGVTVTDEEDAQLKRAMVAAGLRTVVLADHSKRDQVVAHLVLRPEELTTVVTDEPWPELEIVGTQVLTLLRESVEKT